MRVLGVDPGLTRCGVAVVEGRRTPLLRHIGVIRTDATLDTARRLVEVEREITALVEEWLPDVVAVERVFAQQNLNTVIGTAQAAGIAMVVGARSGIPVAQHTPSEVKAAITGSGRADKAQVTSMVTRVLALDTPPKPADAADAAALAVCQLWRGGQSHRLTEAVGQQLRARPELIQQAELQAERQRRAVAQARERHYQRRGRTTERGRS